MTWLRVCLMLSVVYPGAAAMAETLSGVVRDEGEPVAKAEVILVNAATKVVQRSVLADDQGRFVFDVAPGVYNLRVAKDDYALAIVKGIDINRHSKEVVVSLQLVVFAEEGAVPAEEDCE